MDRLGATTDMRHSLYCERRENLLSISKPHINFLKTEPLYILSRISDPATRHRVCGFDERARCPRRTSECFQPIMNAHILLNSSHGRFLILLICCLPLRGGWCSTQDPNYSRQDAHSSVFLNDRTARSRTSSTARVLPAYSDGQVSASGLRSSVLQTQHLSIGALRERLKQRGVSEKQIRSCVEKRELVALVQSLDENEDALPARAECLGVDGHMHLGMDAASRCRGAVVASALEQLQKHKVGGGLQRRSVPSQEGKDSSDLVRLPTSAQAMTSRCTGKRGVAEQDAAMSIGDRERRTSVHGQEAGHRTKRGVEQHGGEEHPQRDGGRGAGGTGVKFSVLGGGRTRRTLW